MKISQNETYISSYAFVGMFVLCTQSTCLKFYVVKLLSGILCLLSEDTLSTSINLINIYDLNKSKQNLWLFWKITGMQK